MKTFYKMRKVYNNEKCCSYQQLSLDNLVNSRAHGPTIRDDKIGPENRENMKYMENIDND